MDESLIPVGRSRKFQRVGLFRLNLSIKKKTSIQGLGLVEASGEWSGHYIRTTKTT